MSKFLDNLLIDFILKIIGHVKNGVSRNKYFGKHFFNFSAVKCMVGQYTVEPP